MFRKGCARAFLLLTAVASLALAISIPGCSSQPILPTAEAKAPAAGTGIKTTVSTQEIAAGRDTQAPPREIVVNLGNGVKLQMVLITAGEFLMGSPDSDKGARDDEKPQHRVRITKHFYLGKYLVTQEQWEAVMGSNPSHFRGPKNPVESVSWENCRAFLAKLNEHVRGGKFQLPTEAQWEYACRAGSTTRYCCGDDDSRLGEYAWHDVDQTHPVGEKKANAWGLYDMHGNTWELCQDWYDGKYYANSPTDDPRGPATGSCRVSRGGGCVDPAGFCRSAYRYGPGITDSTLGLRLALIPADK